MKFALILGAIVCFALPIGSFIYIRKKSPKLGGPLVAGIFTFYLFQMIIRTPILQAVLPSYSWYTDMKLWQTALFLGITAALFETVGRFITMKFLLKDRKSYYSGIAHGIGHGGIEAILLVGLNYIVYVIFTYMISNGTFDAMMVGEEQIVIDQLLYIKDFLTTGDASLIFIAILERIMTFIIQVGLSLLVMEGLISKKYKYILIAFLSHALLDTSAVLLVGKEVNIYLIGAFILLFAGASIYYIKTSKVRFKDNLIAKEDTEKYLKSDY